MNRTKLLLGLLLWYGLLWLVLAIAPRDRQEIALVASVPLSDERWEPLAEGELVVLREGRVVQRERPARTLLASSWL